MRRSRRVGLAIAAALTLSSPGAAQANPAVGEARSTVRDADRVYTVVAGEADGASTVVNPANLGYLTGVNGVFDASITAPSARRRGSGVGAFIGIPLPLQIAAIGLGYQFLFRPQDRTAPGEENSPQGPDDPYSKVSLAVAVPLHRWIRGMSVGGAYSRLVSTTNSHANANELSLAWSYWPTRFLALGVVGRALNSPRTGLTDAQIRQPLVIEPELAVRPLGTPALELAVGTRLSPSRLIVTGDGASDLIGDAPFNTPFLEPRGRIMSSFRGARLFLEAERYIYNPDPLEGGGLEEADAVKLTAGLEVSFGHVGVAAAPVMGAGATSTFGADGAAFRVRVSQERYDTVTVSPRKVTRLVLSNYGGDRGMWRAIELIDEIAKRGGTLLVETRNTRLGWAQAEEVREALLRLRTLGGTVVAYMEGASLRSYFLASAADHIIGHPNIKLGIIGMRIQSFYFGDLLAKLGVRAEFVRFAEYKATPEKYMRNTATKPSGQQRLMYVSDVWNHALRLIARERGHRAETIKGWIDEAPLTPTQAERLGVIDDRAFRDELDAKLEAWLGRPIRIEKPDKFKKHRDAYGPPPRVAVVFLEGDMVDGQSFTIPVLGRKLAGSETLTATIERLRKDASIKAIVLRCNTGGGSVTAADAIARELDLARKVKPVVISMGNACASGGYYSSTAGQYMFADAGTITGSIGVFQPKMDLSGGRELLGIGMDEFNFGAHAGMWSHFKPYTPEERAAAERKVAHDYGVFVGRVGKARSMTPEQVDKVARGRIWSGVRATEEGLIDDYGGLREAVMRARAIAGMPEDRGAVELFPKPAGPLKNIKALLGFRIPGPLAEEQQGSLAGRLAASPVGDAAATGLGILGHLPLPILAALRRIPAPLWLSAEPATMALADSTWELLD